MVLEATDCFRVFRVASTVCTAALFAIGEELICWIVCCTSSAASVYLPRANNSITLALTAVKRFCAAGTATEVSVFCRAAT